MNAIERINAQAGRTAWWSDRWAWRGAIASAPAGALAAILHALAVVRAGWADALLAYGLGAMVAAGIGCLLGGPLGAAGQALRDSRNRRSRPPAATPGDELAAEEAAYLEHEERTYAVAA